MSIYQQFCRERFNENGALTEFQLVYSPHFNFGYDVVDRIAAEEPEKMALVWRNIEGEEHRFTFRDIMRMSNQAANVFMSQGITKGDMVMLVLKRHYEYWYATVALHKLGAVAIPVTHMLTAEDLEYRVNTAKIKAVVSTPEEDIPERLLSILDRCPSLTHLWTVQKSAGGFRNLTEDIKDAPVTMERQDTSAHEPILMYFTSGTTGYPKGVLHDHTYPLSHIITAKYWQKAQDGGLHFTVAETGWGKASWGKIYGQWLVGSAVMVYDFDNFEPKQLMAIINQYQVTTFCAPATIYRYFVRKGMIPMPSLKHVSSAGEALNPEVSKRFTELTGLPLMEGYGQTESALLLGNFSESELRPGSMGKPSPLYHMDLMTPEGELVQTGEIGELVIVPPAGGIQPGLFVGYHENPALYSHVWRYGVYHTGDTAWRDADGYYWFHGRIDDVIKTGGFRVGPFEIENILMEHPAVMESAVFGVPDPLRGQAIRAVVVTAPGYEASTSLQKEIREFCNSRMAEYKWIRQLDFVPVMPKTISGKIRRVDLKETYGA